MPEVMADGFRFFKWFDGRKLLTIESGRLAECVRYINANCIEHLQISPYHGYALNDLDFLRDCNSVASVFMQRGFQNISGALFSPATKVLSAIFPNDINYSRIPSLAELATDWSPKTDRAAAVQVTHALMDTPVQASHPKPRATCDPSSFG